MGEYAKYNGEEVKIGTCEDMYYLRYDQRHKVQKIPSSLDPADPQVIHSLRFRFPFPDEDGIAPGGDFHSHGYKRAFRVSDYECPEGVEHYSVQFKADKGYLLSIPCPEGAEGRAFQERTGIKVARNGFSGGVGFGQQKLLPDGRLILILDCLSCGAKWRAENFSQVEPILEELLRPCHWQESVRDIENRAEIVRRILAGYKVDRTVADITPHHITLEREKELRAMDRAAGVNNE